MDASATTEGTTRRNGFLFCLVVKKKRSMCC
jgi:hypothetical protein